MDGSVSLNIEDSCKFQFNHGSSIYALNTMVTLSGVIIFEDNSAFQGGAIWLSYSTLRLASINNSNTIIQFVNNSATSVGGSIYVDQSLKMDTNSGSSCFYDLQGVSMRNEIMSFKVTFRDNKAANGGIDIYGATPKSDCWLGYINGTFQYVPLSSVYGYVFKTFANFSSISSDPRRVCLCDSSSQLMCANLSHIFYNTTRYPGEVFSLSLAVVGFEFGTVTGPVYANLLPQENNSMSSLENDQYVRQVDYSGCTSLEFSVNSLNSVETIVLTANATRITKQDDPSYISSYIKSYNEDSYHVIPYTLLSVPVYIEVTLLDCPSGFQLNKTTGKCECNTALKDMGITDCSVYCSTSYITRSKNQWVKQVFNPDGILSSSFCPHNYCKQDIIRLNLSNPDEQCDLSHSGILCGACPTNLSLAIGSSRCLKCSDNYHTLLLIAFAAAGIVLVLFIKILDMTVAIGTINGLILYANIIWANQSVLFPPQTSSLLQFLKTFIAWLNLDLGIETCFIQHLDGYWKTWLQFAFPAYIWLIAGLIILVSHYSTRATKIFGNNSVSVLTTLFLLSYAKLLRAILIVLEFTLLESPDGQQIVWSFDGNVQYFSLKHSILFIVALIILVTLWLPYTLVLLFIQCLRRHSHHRLLRWVTKLNPLFDSYLGPLKHKHHYWIGLGLLARLVLLLTTAVTMTTIPFLAIAVIMITAIASLLCLLVLDVYKQWQLSMLEGCFLVNMAIFSSGAFGGNKYSLACTSIGIAFILFLAIIGYHVWRRCRSLKRQHVNGYEAIDNFQTPPPQSSSQCQSTTYQEVSVPKLRESLLESVTA